MSQDTLSPVDEFISTLNEEKERDTKFPFESMFMKINDGLSGLRDPISGDFPTELTDPLEKSIVDLNKLLNECLTMSKKQRERKTVRENCYSPFFICSTKEKLKKILKKIKEIEKNPPKKPEDKAGRKAASAMEWTTSYVDESTVFGWDDVVEDIKKELLKEKVKLNLVGIVGIFGSGKTTLAQKVFATEEVMDNFELRLWVWVSPKCRRVELLRRILENIGLEHEYVESILKIDPNKEVLGVLLFLLHVHLMDKKYLIVFDDIRNVGQWHCELQKDPPKNPTEDWCARLAYGLPKGNGSAIIVTTTKVEDARKIVGNEGLVVTPKPLKGEHGWAYGWALFKSAYEEGGSKVPPDLEAMKELITEKCDGLPLALKTAGQEMSRRAAAKERESFPTDQKKLDNDGEALLREQGHLDGAK
ncbi:putative disease resistance protein At5g45490 [Tasmannia lanceolata]|uniref:putative disease resistance protein At5g45490 n=1 Tax=Tasmannia lanceolata TaxID=3420 RepID=UPI0040642C51